MSIGDRSGLPIWSTGSSILPSAIRPFHLHNVLYVPTLSHDLLSVS